jgi:pilus assembly protein CpaB
VKRISPATVTFGVMAIVLGLVSAYVVRQALSKPPVVAKPAPEPPKPEMVSVVFARNVIPKNTQLTAEDVFVSQVPKSMKLPAGTFRGVNLVEGRITKETIAAGRVLRETNLLGLDESLPDLSQRLPAGHRAVTISVEGADTGGKRLAEGDRIDLALTVEGTHPDLGEVLTRTLLRNVLIVDAEANRPRSRTPRRPGERPTSTITVAVPPAEANKLIVAQRTGVLQATLVSAQDADRPIDSDDAVNRRQLLGLKEVPPPKKFTIEKWSGNRVQILEMSDDRIRESRNVSMSGQTSPVNRPAANEDVGLNRASGVTAPLVSYEASDAPVAAPAASPATESN